MLKVLPSIGIQVKSCQQLVLLCGDHYFQVYKDELTLRSLPVYVLGSFPESVQSVQA